MFFGVFSTLQVKSKEELLTHMIDYGENVTRNLST